MIRAAALSCAVIGAAGAAVAQQTYEIDRFDVTGQVPVGYGPATFSENFDGQVYDALDGQAQLVVFAGFDLLGGLEPEREVTRQGLLMRDATITEKYVYSDAFSYVGLEPNGWRYFRYTRFGETCEGDAVTGSFMLRYAPASREMYETHVGRLVAFMHIGACG